MAKPSSFRFIVRYSHHVSSKSSARGYTISCDISRFVANHSRTIQNPSLSCSLPRTSRRANFPSPSNVLGLVGNLDSRSSRTVLGIRYFSSKEYGKDYKKFAKSLVKNPGSAVQNTIARYGDAVGLHIEAFWKRNYLWVVGAGGVLICSLLWKVLFGIANAFVGLSEGLAKYGFLSLSCATVAFTGLYFHLKYTISPDKVYHMVMRKLNTSPGILEIMGAPLTGTDLRAYVMSGGGATLKNFRPRLRSKRCFLIFPIRGLERKGLVSVEVKKKKGQYDIKLLAIDIPMASGPDQRLFLIGDEDEYRIGGGLTSELRDPVLKALAAAEEFEARDEKEDEEDAARELEKVEKKHWEELEKLEKGMS